MKLVVTEIPIEKEASEDLLGNDKNAPTGGEVGEPEDEIEGIEGG